MLSNTFKITAVSLSLLLTGCAVTSANQMHRTHSGEEMIVSGRMQYGQVAIYINGEEAISKASIFEEKKVGTYNGKKVVALCKHTKHFFSVENECDVYIDGRFATNLYLK